MDQATAIEGIRRNRDAVHALGATGLHLFGSVARGEAKADSDIDIFVEYDTARRFSLLNLASIKVLLEEALGTGVDITTRDSLHPLLRERIERSAVRVF